MLLTVRVSKHGSGSQFYASDPMAGPPSQPHLMDDIQHQLGGQTWQFPPDRLAKVLSAKTRPKTCPNTPSTHYSTLDSLKNYKCTIESDSHKAALEKAQRLFLSRDTPQYLSTGKNEVEHYQGVVNLLNDGLDSCRRSGLGTGETIFSELMFWAWAKPVGDKDDGARAIAPDVAGALGTEEPTELFWSPKPGKRGLKIPVEVKKSWFRLVKQAGTCARALFSAHPLRQFVLVIGYNHAEYAMRFLVFHRGGLTASTPLLLDTKTGQNDFILLLSAILTWKTPQDAGFPAWCNENQIFLPKIHSSPIDIARILHHTSCIRGRAPRVYYLRIPLPSDSKTAEQAFVPPQDQCVPADAQILRRSPRNHAPKRSTRDQPKSSHPRQHDRAPPKTGAVSSVKQGNEGGIVKVLTAQLAKFKVTGHRLKKKKSSELNDNASLAQLGVDDSSAELSVDGLPVDNVPTIQISRIAACQQYAPSATRSPAPTNRNNFKVDGLKLGDYAVLKLSWNPGRGPEHEPVEPKLLEQCGGMFGVPHHYYSFLAHHQDNYPTTNHLFLPSGESNTDKNLHWNVFKVKDDSLDFRSLMRAIVHAHLGYYNMCQKDFQHRDISIGNVLMVDEPIKTERFQIPNPNKTQKMILDLCKKLNISDDCVGFVIDGDMAVNWATYFKEPHTGGKSGTFEFMSNELLLKAPTKHYHSPVDDYNSFYFVAQWACAFNASSSLKDMTSLQLLRSWLGSGGLRALATSEVAGPIDLSEEDYGAFLVQAQPFLRDWSKALGQLVDEWNKMKKMDISKGNSRDSFRSIVDRGLELFLEVVVAHKDLCFENTRTWLADVRQHADSHLTCNLVGNKVDVCEEEDLTPSESNPASSTGHSRTSSSSPAKKRKRQVPTAEAELFANEEGSLSVESSAKSGLNVEVAFEQAAKDILDKVKGGVFDEDDLRFTRC
ncbi:hypothetical protein D9757_013324 [Collybiopsis confluens]|uniref:Fungal-type protein kinase domain-containing protein n=1 Tax=Collybiopsis confluens TaxID=2823264 RepID=A0A8H5G351_9AGAR|nr:hypothetical protein D9757_013324 [Collybiopsis confluens]